MKKTLRTTFAAALFAALVSASAAAATKYGKGVSEAASVKLSELMAKPDVDGALVGGASLDPEEFAKIVLFYQR